jgi:hypothetical protein
MMASLNDVLIVSSDSDEDDDLQILSESIVPQLTPVERSRLLVQLNLSPNASVKIRVSGGESGKRSLMGGRLAVAKCTVTSEGRIIQEKSLQSRKIFGPAKKPSQDAAPAQILTVSDDEPDEFEPEISPVFKKVTLRNKKELLKVTDHLFKQHRHRAASVHELQVDQEPAAVVPDQAGVPNYNKECTDHQDLS